MRSTPTWTLIDIKRACGMSRSSCPNHVIFFGGMDAVVGPMIRQMNQLGIDARFVGGAGMCSGELAKLAGGNLADQQVWCAEAGRCRRRWRTARPATRTSMAKR